MSAPSEITIKRRALVNAVGALGAGPVAEVLPTKVNTATLIGFAPADDYVSPDEATFAGDLRLRVYAYALVKPKNDRHDLEQLDHLLDALYAGARGSGWAIERTDEPDVLKYGDWAMYGTRLTLTTLV